MVFTGRFFLFLLFILSATHEASLKIIASYVLPHGGIALDPTHFNTTNATALKQAWEIHNACKQVGEDITAHEPDLIFLSTPHGISDLQNFVLYLNPKAAGFADTDNCVCPPCCYNASVNVDTTTSEEILVTIGSGRNLSGLSGFGPPGQSGEPFPLRWGEVIPLHFIPGLSNTKVVILSQPSRRYTEDVKMIPELLQLGSELFAILESSTKKVAVVISADLAHTHSASGPYGYSNTSQPFDEACGKWAHALNPQHLLVTAASLVDQALSCGYTGLVMLHGLLETPGLDLWIPTVLVNHHPSYYGMMVASFHRRGYFPISVHVQP